MMTAEDFLKKLAIGGGAIISSSDCTPEEIADARANDNFFVDACNLGYVWMSLEEYTDE